MSHPPVRQEADAIRMKPVIAALLTALALSGGAVLWGWLELRADIAALQPEGLRYVRPVPIGPPNIGGIKQTMIGIDSSATMLVLSERARLERWGWVNRAQGVVHIPIEAAMRAVIEEARP